MMDRLWEKDYTLKVLSVCLAVLLWFQAAATSGPTLPQSVRDVPVEFRNLGQGLVVLSDKPTVTLLVRGRSDMLQHLGKDAFTAYVDLRGAGLGTGSFPVVVESPDSVSVAQVNPAEVRVDIDAWDNAQVPVSVWTLGSPAEDHAMKSHTARPTDLYVEGPRSSVQMVNRVVAKVDIEGANGNITRTVVVRPVNAEGAEVHGVTVTPAAVDIQIAIVKLPPAIEVPARANVQGRPAAGYVQESVRVTPETIRIWAQGQISNDIRYLWTHPIDIEGATATIERDVTLLVPDGVDKIEPQQVRVTITITEVQEEREFRDVPIGISGLGQGLKGRAEPAVATVIVRGSRSQVMALDPTDLSVRVDVAGRGAGSYDLPVAVALPEGLSAKTVTPPQVKVVLETQ